MLFLHEVHQVAGLKEDEFEAAFREGWMPTLAKDDDARLLWYTNHAARERRVVPGGHRHRRARRRRVGTARAADPERRPAGLDARRRRAAPRRHRQAAPALPWSPMQDVDLADRADRRRRARAHHVHGRHDVADRGQVPRLRRGVGHRSTRSRSNTRARSGEPAVPPDRGRVPTGVRLARSPRGHADAAHPRPAAAARPAHARDRARDARARHVDARRAAAARPMGEQAAAHVVLVSALY